MSLENHLTLIYASQGTCGTMYVNMLITRLCYLFNKISQKVIDKDDLRDLQEFIEETMA